MTCLCMDGVTSFHCHFDIHAQHLKSSRVCMPLADPACVVLYEGSNSERQMLVNILQRGECPFVRCLHYAWSMKCFSVQELLQAFKSDFMKPLFCCGTLTWRLYVCNHCIPLVMYEGQHWDPLIHCNGPWQKSLQYCQVSKGSNSLSGAIWPNLYNF